MCVFILNSGGVNLETIDIVGKAGANVIVSGSGIYRHPEPQKAISLMRESINNYINK